MRFQLLNYENLMQQTNTSNYLELGGFVNVIIFIHRHSN